MVGLHPRGVSTQEPIPGDKHIVSRRRCQILVKDNITSCHRGRQWFVRTHVCGSPPKEAFQRHCVQGLDTLRKVPLVPR